MLPLERKRLHTVVFSHQKDMKFKEMKKKKENNQKLKVNFPALFSSY